MSKNASQMWVTRVSHTSPNEDKCMIFDMRKSLGIASIDCRATTFDSSHDDDDNDDEPDARVPASSA